MPLWTTFKPAVSPGLRGTNGDSIRLETAEPSGYSYLGLQSDTHGKKRMKIREHKYNIFQKIPFVYKT